MLMKKLSSSRSRNRQSGLSLLESLVALVVLALGIMGLAGVQTRLLVETRTANSRAIAVQLIDDLSNRMALNRYAAVGQPQLAVPVASSYVLAWSDTTGVGTAMPTTNPFNCSTNICTPAQLAASDLFQWRTAVNASFPGARATVSQLPANNNDPRQLAVAIAWSSNERTIRNATAADNTTYNTPFNVDATNSAIACPAGPPAFICHVVYVQP
jgi:type IV pilus assembly protein PilV